MLSAQTRAWDCPCHNSRFLFDGTLVQGPAARSLVRYAACQRGDGRVLIDLGKKI